MGHARKGWLVAGAGFTGAPAARLLAEATGEPVLVIDRRDHIGGNAFDARNAEGVTVHRYGPHIFHTNSDAVFAFLSRFTAWRPYEHRVQAEIDGRLVPLPFGFQAIEALFPAARAARLIALLTERYGAEARVPILKLRQSEDGELKELAAFIYDKVFAGYTLKQWGMPAEALSPSVTARVPVIVLRHEMGPDHPECPDRVSVIADRLLSRGLLDFMDSFDAPQATEAQILRAHEGRHYAELRARAGRGLCRAVRADAGPSAHRGGAVDAAGEPAAGAAGAAHGLYRAARRLFRA
jgi:hypothetical protein